MNKTALTKKIALSALAIFSLMIMTQVNFTRTIKRYDGKPSCHRNGRHLFARY